MRAEGGRTQVMNSSSLNYSRQMTIPLVEWQEKTAETGGRSGQPVDDCNLCISLGLSWPLLAQRLGMVGFRHPRQEALERLEEAAEGAEHNRHRISWQKPMLQDDAEEKLHSG